MTPDPLSVSQFQPDLDRASTTVPRVLAALPRWILATKTRFSAMLARSFHIRPRGVSSPTVVFPLPLMDFGLFDRGPKLVSSKWKALLRKRLLHLVILVGRQPNRLQKKVHARLLSLCTTCDLSGALAISMIPGRSGHEFIDALNRLEHFAKRRQLFDIKGYTDGPADFEKCASRIEKEDAVDPAPAMYTSLNAQRLKLVGTGQWRVQDRLHDELWLPYVEPRVLKHGEPIDYSAGPNLDKEKRGEYLALAKKWSKLGLLALTNKKPADGTFTRVFNCFKSSEHDRQIGERRLANASEYAISGPSKFLPSGFLLPTLRSLEVAVFLEPLLIENIFMSHHKCSAIQLPSGSF